MPESLIPPVVRQVLTAAYRTLILEDERCAAQLESRGQSHLHQQVADRYAAAQIAEMERLGDEHGLRYHLSEVAIETHAAPVPRFWMAWRRMTDELRLFGPTPTSYWFPKGAWEMPPMPHESVARDLAAREPLPPPAPPPPSPGMTAIEVERIVAAAIAAAVAKPEATEATVEHLDGAGRVKLTQMVRTTRRPL